MTRLAKALAWICAVIAADWCAERWNHCETDIEYETQSALSGLGLTEYSSLSSPPWHEPAPWEDETVQLVLSHSRVYLAYGYAKELA